MRLRTDPPRLGEIAGLLALLVVFAAVIFRAFDGGA